jgi:hypothetical protein
MDVSGITGDPQEILRRLVAPFFAQGSSPVYAASCCGRLFAGSEWPKKCRGCDRVPAYAAFNTPEDVSIEAIPDQPPR